MKEIQDISSVVSQYMCSTCGACCAVCSFDAIDYQETIGGYMFPTIDYDKCTQCGLCYKVCPGIHFGSNLQTALPQDPFIGEIISCSVGRAINEKIFRNAQSGGIATAILRNMFITGQIDAAVVAVMKDQPNPRGEVTIIENPDDLYAAQKSKYTPIPMLKALKEIESRKLKTAIVGLPCHMHGLENMKDFKPALKELLVLKLGLVCEHVLTTTAIEFLGRKATASPITHLVFKDKNRPNYPGNPIVTTSDGRQIKINDSVRKRIKEYFTPVRCRLCFDKLNIFADLVAADPHGIDGVDRTGGETLIITRTKRGEEILRRAVQEGDVALRQVDTEAAICGQGIGKKRKDWAGYMRAWEEMGMTLPHYHFPRIEAQETNRYKKELRRAIALDKVRSRKILYKSADSWLKRKRLMKRLKSIISKARGKRR